MCNCYEAYSGTNCEKELVRLVSRNNKIAAGRVEIFDETLGEYGTICDDNWSQDLADRLCRMLGWSKAARKLHRFGRAKLGTPILWRDLTCPVNESNLFNCTWKEASQCTHSEDVGLYCKKERLSKKYLTRMKLRAKKGKLY